MYESFNKKYINTPAIGRAMCLKAEGSKMLKRFKYYDLLKQTDDKLLIRFNSQGACWYDADRFLVVDA
jgi:hypothetical protein